MAGDSFYVLDDITQARQLAEARAAVLCDEAVKLVHQLVNLPLQLRHPRGIDAVAPIGDRLACRLHALAIHHRQLRQGGLELAQARGGIGEAHRVGRGGLPGLLPRTLGSLRPTSTWASSPAAFLIREG